MFAFYDDDDDDDYDDGTSEVDFRGSIIIIIWTIGCFALFTISGRPISVIFWSISCDVLYMLVYYLLCPIRAGLLVVFATLTLSGPIMTYYVILWSISCDVLYMLDQCSYQYQLYQLSLH